MPLDWSVAFKKINQLKNNNLIFNCKKRGLKNYKALKKSSAPRRNYIDSIFGAELFNKENLFPTVV